MSAATLPLPSAHVDELAAANAFAATGIPDLPVFMGPSSAGPINVPTLFGAGDTVSLLATFGIGDAIKETVAAVVDVAQSFVFMRMTIATVATLLTTPVVVKNVSSTFTSTLSGTATDGGDILITFTLGGTTGTGPITYTVTIGGVVGSPISLATATTIVVLGVTVTLGSAHVVTTGDTIAWMQWPPSSTILPLNLTGVVGSSVITATGTPLGTYEIAWKVVDDGSAGAGTTIGSLGTTGAAIKFQYATDYFGSASPSYSSTQSLGLNNSFLLLDGPIDQHSTGVTLNFAAGTLKTGDIVIFRTSPPTYDSAGLVAATTALATAFNTGVVQWSWVRAIGPQPESIIASADAILLAWEGSAAPAGCQPSWMVCDALDRAGSGQPLRAWSAYLAASYAQFTSTHVGVSAGMLRGFDPINGCLSRRAAMAWFMARAMGADGCTIATDWAQKDLGALNASVTMNDSTGQAVEHDANIDPSLQAMGFITARHWPGEAGVYPTRASLLGPENDIKSIALRRVMRLAKILEARALTLQCVKNFLQWTSQPGPHQAKSPYQAGDIFEVDALRIEKVVNNLLTLGVYNQGYVSNIFFALNRTPISLGGGRYKIRGAMQIVALLYVDVANGTAQFVSAGG